jgi:NDP-sugar pyrophosphorylase family protein
LTQGRPFFIGAAVLEPEALVHVPIAGPAEFVPTILEPMIAQKKAGYFLTSGEWRDIGAPDLWLDAHVFLLRALETGRLHAPWRHRIESRNRRIANEIWVDQNAPHVRTIDWAGPCYWDGQGEPPRALGPSSVQYLWAKLGN